MGALPLTLGALARAAGVNPETIRYYERRGLLPEPPRTAAGYRQYDAGDAERVALILRAKDLGFTLAEIGELIALDASDDRARARELAQSRVAAIDEKIAELQAARDALSGLASDCANKRSGPCPILRAFDPRTALP